MSSTPSTLVGVNLDDLTSSPGAEAEMGISAEQEKRTESQSSSSTAAQTQVDVTPQNEKQQSTSSSQTSDRLGLTLAWDHLSIRGIGGKDDIIFHPDLGTLLTPWVGARSRKRAAQLAQQRAGSEAGSVDPTNAMAWSKGMPTRGKNEPGLRKGERYILKDFSGILHPGEMMLVVGRPGSGCSTLLKSLAGLTGAYAGMDGSVQYGSMESRSKEFKPYRSLVCFNSEEDVHDPNLTVGRTMEFATRNELVSKSARAHGENRQALSDVEGRKWIKDRWLSEFGITHTHNTKVGDQYVRGVSGGERRRLTLAEAMTTDASIYCWDNATRGLDANTALAYAQTCRELSDTQNKIHVVSLYQAGNAIYNLFDKITVLAEGQVIYFGPREDARPYFEALGFEHMDGANTADFLTAVTVKAERRIRENFNRSVPNSPHEFAIAYQQSDVAKRMSQQLHDHQANSSVVTKATHLVQQATDGKKNKGAPKRSAEISNYPTQLKAALIREYQQRWGDRWTFWARQASTFLLAWMTGSVFYQIPTTTSGLFLRRGTIFSTLIYPIIMAFSDVQIAFQGRPVMAKHRAYSMYRPAAVFISQTLADMPILLVQIFILDVIVYFMSGLQYDAGKFFTFLLFSFVLTSTITAFFRAVGYLTSAYNDATKITGGVFTAFVVYSGYVLYQPAMHPWLSWIRWLNPIYYSIEALLSNELSGLTFDCVPRQLAPFGAEYAGGPAGCAITGALPGETFVTGQAYMDTALQFSTSHIWRNFGIIIAWWIFYVVLGCIAIENIPAAGSSRGVTLYKNGSEPADDAASVNGTEEGGSERIEGMESSDTTFTWQDLTYTVKADGQDKVLLSEVSGYCKAGTLTALMGSSGAGKTTLMDVLAARKDEGEIQGHVLLNGRPLPVSFQRTTGYCEQLDVHLPTATVREALEFSALLRQPRKYTKEQKLAYVDTIIDLLEMRDLCDALVGVPGAGLGVEQRKRLTIGVELVSRPTLLFLDEPTSGLDGQSSYMILQFLRKLVSHGQSVLCTIHQPSAALFAEFDQLLLLKGGGKTVYFGAVSEMGDYFKEQGIDFPSSENPAELMIDIVSGSKSEGRDWAKVWLESKHRDQRMQELEELTHGSNGETREEENSYEYASTFSAQLSIVCERAFVQLWRDLEYVTNKFALHILVGLLVGFSYWKIGNSYADLQTRMFALFNFVFVAPGVMVQTQPKFIANRDVFEKREKKAKLYSWKVFCIAEIVAELPYLVVCAALFWCCWYATAGLSLAANVAGPIFLTMFFYEMLYTGIAQFIAAYAPNPPFAALLIPVVIATLVTFSGVLIPYSQLTTFWKYWMYYLDPFKYLLGALVSFASWHEDVVCKEEEFGRFDPPAGMTCGEYMSGFLQQATGYIDDANATSDCRYCGYSNGQEYLADLNLPKQVYAWRDMLITLLFVCSSYALVFVLLKLRSKRSKMAQ